MKKIKTDQIVENVRRQPFTKASLEHLQEAFQEVITDLMNGLTENASGVTILHGCVDSDASATAWNISAGAALYSGEIYPIDAFIGSHATQVPVLSIESTYRAGDPVSFSDNTTNNVHEIRKLKWAMGVSGSGISDFGAVKRFKNTLFTAFYKNSAGVESTVQLRKRIIEIGSWDMTATASVTLDHGLPDHKKIRSVSVIVQRDASGSGPTLYDFLGVSMTNSGSGTALTGVREGQIAGLNSTQITLSKVPNNPTGPSGPLQLSAVFDSSNFNDTGINRGWITFEYEV